MHVIIEVFDKLFKLGHPANSQVTVLKKNPTTFLSVVIYHNSSFLSLTLTQWNRLDSLTHTGLFGESEEISNRIRTSRKHENKGGLNAGIFVAFSKIKSWGDDESFSHLFSNPVLDGSNHLVWPESFEEDDFLEIIQLIVPVLRHRFLVSIAAIKNILEFIGFLHEVFIQSLECWQCCWHAIYLLVHIRPGIFVDPGCRIRWNFDLSRRTCQEISEFIFSQRFISKQYFCGQHEGKD